MAEPVGPLVVSGGRWALPDGRRGQLVRSVAAEAATLGAAVVIVVGDPDAHPLWEEGVTATCTGGAGTANEWRWRAEVPGAEPVPTLVLVGRDTGRRGGPWGPGLMALDVAESLRVLQQLLGVPWGHSTSRTVEHLILSTHPVRKGGRKLDRDPQVPDVARGCERRYHWLRGLAGWELSAAYVHTYDANAAYLGTMGSLDLGFGRPVHYKSPRGCQPRIGWPGLWRVDVPADLGTGAGSYPPIATGEWVTTPTLHRLSEYSEAQGLGAVIPEEGWAYPERARWLSGAAVRLRDARTAAREEEARAQAAILAAESDAALSVALCRYVTAGVVREAVKELYTVLPGRFASSADYVTAGWRRPDWAAAIIGTFRVNLHRKISRLDCPPFAIGTDALAFASDVADPVEHARAIGLRLGDSLGEFAVQGSAQLVDVGEHLAHGRGGIVGLFGAVKRSSRTLAAVAA